MLASVLFKAPQTSFLVMYLASVSRLTFYYTKTFEFKMTKKVSSPLLQKLCQSVLDQGYKEIRNLTLPSIRTQIKKLQTLVRTLVSGGVQSTASTYTCRSSHDSPPAEVFPLKKRVFVKTNVILRSHFQLQALKAKVPERKKNIYRQNICHQGQSRNLQRNLRVSILAIQLALNLIGK